LIQTSTLKGISEFIRTGKTPPTQEAKYFNGEIQWFTPGDLDKEKYLGKSMRSLTEASFIDKKAAHFPAGTLLVACIGDIGKLGITTQDCSSNQQITGIKPNSSTDVNYLYYWFRHSKMVIQHFANNAVVPIINNGTLEKIKIPLPPPTRTTKDCQYIRCSGQSKTKRPTTH
jgi:type I restriction enzyme S subunit